ncbi:MAG: hypothetical protein GXP25_04580 [Planctomycetes bacterium]|nr:hypothetical protein [Planctomycetota bacterium]
MVTKVRFPKFDANITEGMIGQWRVAEGDAVQDGDPLVEVITDKATFDLEAEEVGVLRRIIAKEKSTVPVGYVIALIGDEGDELPDVAEENERILAEHQKAAIEMTAKGEAKAKASPSRQGSRVKVRAVPSARRMAKEAGIDIADVPPSEGNPIVTEDDVRRYLDSTSNKGEPS